MSKYENLESSSDYPEHDTDWDRSAKGNYWRRIDGIVIVVGESKYSADCWWSMCDGDFADAAYSNMYRAMEAAEELQREKYYKRLGFK